MSDFRQDISDYCERIGNDLNLVQGAGGNVSWKEAETGIMWIKASGTWLSEANQKNIFVPVDFAALAAAIRSKDYSTAPSVLQGQELRPSIETILHGIMPHKVVSHTHMRGALKYLVQSKAHEALTQLLPSDLSWTTVDYAKPGPDLGALVHAEIQKRPADIVFLKNHGVIVGAESIEQVENLYARLDEALKVSNPDDGFNSTGSELQNYELEATADYHMLGLNETIFSKINAAWALYPDHIVFLGAEPNVFDSFDAFKQASIADPLLYGIVKNNGVYISNSANKNVRAMLNFYSWVMFDTADIEHYNMLSKEDIAALLNWDAEKYRKSIAK